MTSDQPAFLRVPEVGVDDVHRYPDLIGDLYGQRLGGLIVRGFLPASALATVRARLEGAKDSFVSRAVDPSGHLRCFGLGLGDVGGADISAYLAQVDVFRENVSDLFSDMPGFEARFKEVLSKVSNQRRVDVARAENGRPYLPLTIRRLGEGGMIPPHFELQVLSSQSYRQLIRTIDVTTMLSFVVQLALPESGGELIVHDLRWDEDEAKALAERGQPLEPLTARRSQMRVQLDEGALVLFDSGRFAHRVGVVGGSRPRWTIGGFVSMGRDGSSVSYWS